MKRNALACGALVLGMLAGFAVRGALEDSDVCQIYRRIEGKTVSGQTSAVRNETDLLGEPLHRIATAACVASPRPSAVISALKPSQEMPWDQSAAYAMTWDAERGWFDYGEYAPEELPDNLLFWPQR